MPETPPKGPKRAGTVIGDHNDDRSHVPVPPRGVGLTRSPVKMPALRPQEPQAYPVVPRREFDFDQKTPPAMDPTTWHALQSLRSGQQLNDDISLAVLHLLEAREEREAKERENARRRQWVLAVIAAIATAITGVIAAVHGVS